MNNKAFTLVELLAVIIILAIISIIISPVIMDTIKESRENTTVLSAEKYIQGVKLALTDRGLENKPTLTECVVKSDKTGFLTCDNDEVLEVETKGDIPTGGVITIEEYSVVSVSDLEFKNGKVNSPDGVEFIFDK